MTNLYVLLIAIGVVIIAGVFAYNWWQERQYYKQTEKNFSPLKSDALLDDPSFNLEAAKEHFADTIVDVHSPKNAKKTAEPNITNQQIGNSANVKEQVASSTALTDANLDKEAQLPDNVSINEAYSELSQARVANNASTQSAKPAKREDIKAIFDDAFGHKNKVDQVQNASGIATSTQPTTAQQELGQMSQPSKQPSANIAPDEAKLQHDWNAIPLPAMLQPKIDYTAVMHLSRELPASSLVSALTGHFDGYDKPVFIHTITSNALELNQNTAELWTLMKDVSPHQKVSKIAFSVQLADRSGAISRNLLNRFQLAVGEISKQLNAALVWQESGDLLAKANALDAFCIEVDKTIGFHLVHGEQGPFTGTKLKGLAETNGFSLDADGSFKYYDERGQVAFIMFNRENFRFNTEVLRNSVIKSITFQLDIPHVVEGTQIFDRMVQVARQMELGLNAALVDEGNKLLVDTQLDKIRLQLKSIHSTMIAGGVVPGSVSAIRLFS
jgi:FtsZ-interacting cell division protein ZipA